MPECNVRFKFSVGDTVRIIAAKRTATVKALWVDTDGIKQHMCEWFTDGGEQSCVYFKERELEAV